MAGGMALVVEFEPVPLVLVGPVSTKSSLHGLDLSAAVAQVFSLTSAANGRVLERASALSSIKWCAQSGLLHG